MNKIKIQSTGGNSEAAAENGSARSEAGDGNVSTGNIGSTPSPGSLATIWNWLKTLIDRK